MSAAWSGPAPPHHPNVRVVVAHIGEWEARVFALRDERAVCLLRRGMAHAQLWHPTQGVSFLTPDADPIRAAYKAHVLVPARYLSLLGGLGSPGSPVPDV